ncbi:4Fe-4S binding protein [Vibrio cholerae O1]|nr:4Fe-4S binding protein [Vibrio cholerae O1]
MTEIFCAFSYHYSKNDHLDEEKCIGCGICEKNCPAGVMHKVLRQPV